MRATRIIKTKEKQTSIFDLQMFSLQVHQNVYKYWQSQLPLVVSLMPMKFKVNLIKIFNLIKTVGED